MQNNRRLTRRQSDQIYYQEALTGPFFNEDLYYLYQTGGKLSGEDKITFGEYFDYPSLYNEIYNGLYNDAYNESYNESYDEPYDELYKKPAIKRRLKTTNFRKTNQYGGNTTITSPVKSSIKSPVKLPITSPINNSEQRPSMKPLKSKKTKKTTDDLGEQPLGFLTLEKFLSYFPPIKMSKPEFAKRFIVSYRTPLSLAEIYSKQPGYGKDADGEKSIIKSTDDVRWRKRQDVIDYFYDIVIQNRHKYLTHFYHSFFDFKDPMTLDWETGPEIKARSTGSSKKNALNLSEDEEINGISMQKNDASRRLIRNLFYKDILDYTQITNSVKSKVSFWQTFDNLYNKLILEDRLFAPSSIDLFLKDKRGNERISPSSKPASSKASKAFSTFDEDFDDDYKNQKKTKSNLDETNYVTMYYLIQNYQPKASILNPYTIYYIIDRLLPGTKNLFTPVLSWGSYLMAFMHLPYTETYVGVDVIPRVCAKVEFLADWYKKNYPETRDKKVDIYCQPSESLLYDKQFIRKYTNFFDSVLLCPPYFDMEIYQGGDQSVESYPKYEDWLKGYWEDTVKLCNITLRKGRFFAYIINDYYDLNKNYYPLIDDLAKISSKYFTLVDVYTLYNRTSTLRANHKDRSEKLYIFQK